MLREDGWHINLTFYFHFGCCSPCPPGVPCGAACSNCGTGGYGNGEGYFVINDDGLIKEEEIREIFCKTGARPFFNGSSLGDLYEDDFCHLDWAYLDETGELRLLEE